MGKFRNIKVRVPDVRISEAVQRELFKDPGVRWFRGDRIPNAFGHTYLMISADGVLTCSSNNSEFINNKGREVEARSIIDPLYDVRIAWANGNAVQRLVQADGGDKWIEWHCNESIDLSAGEEWRVKPKTKTYKQWERGYWDGLRVGVVMSVDRNPDWSIMDYEWVEEPILKEYEVPND